MLWERVQIHQDVILDGLSCPPFGLGFRRRVRQLATGMTAAGIPYQTLDYTYIQARKDQRSYVATMRLAAAFPSCFLSLPDNPRALITGLSIENPAGLLVVAQTPDFGRDILTYALPAIREYARRRPLDIAIDGHSLTAHHLPAKGPDLPAAMEDLAMVATTLNNTAELRRHQVPPPVGMGWYGFPGWTYLFSDDSVASDPPPTTDILRYNGPEGSDITLSPSGSVPPTLAFRHHGDTMEFRHDYGDDYNGSVGYGVGDGFGYINPRSATSAGLEWVSCLLDFPLPQIGVGIAAAGPRLFFGDPVLEERYPVYSKDSAIATAMIRSVADTIKARKPPVFMFRGNKVWFMIDEMAAKSVQWCQEFTDALLREIPPPVWEMQGYPTNPYLGELR